MPHKPSTPHHKRKMQKAAFTARTGWANWDQACVAGHGDWALGSDAMRFASLGPRQMPTVMTSISSCLLLSHNEPLHGGDDVARIGASTSPRPTYQWCATCIGASNRTSKHRCFCPLSRHPRLSWLPIWCAQLVQCAKVGRYLCSFRRRQNLSGYANRRLPGLNGGRL